MFPIFFPVFHLRLLAIETPLLSNLKMIPNVNFTHFMSHTLKFCRIPKYDYYFERRGGGGGGGGGGGSWYMHIHTCVIKNSLNWEFASLTEIWKLLRPNLNARQCIMHLHRLFFCFSLVALFYQRLVDPYDTVPLLFRAFSIVLG